MEELKQNVSDLTELFHKKMEEFEKNLPGISTQSSSPIGKLTVEFSSFKSFMIFALKSLQQQMEVLANQQDHFEMRSRRKMLLLHGVPETKKENLSDILGKLFNDHLSVTGVSFSKCNRMGQSIDKSKDSESKRPRPIIVEFKDTAVRDQVWYKKTGFKSSGITVSEFLTKSRHRTFIAARQRFGISNCWTRNGYIIVNQSNGKRHGIVSMVELNAVTDPPCATATTNSTHEDGRDASSVRTRRVNKPK